MLLKFSMGNKQCLNENSNKIIDSYEKQSKEVNWNGNHDINLKIWCLSELYVFTLNLISSDWIEFIIKILLKYSPQYDVVLILKMVYWLEFRHFKFIIVLKLARNGKFSKHLNFQTGTLMLYSGISKISTILRPWIIKKFLIILTYF